MISSRGRLLRPRARSVALAGVALLAAAASPALASAGAATPAQAVAGVQQRAGTVVLTQPRSAASSGYQVIVQRAPFQVTTVEHGTVMQTMPAAGGGSGPAGFHTASGWHSATAVQDATWNGRTLELTLATDVAGDTIDYSISPQTDRYQVNWTVTGQDAADQVATQYNTAASGHWYGMGEASTPDGGPYTRQPWPLDSGKVHDSAMGPAEYLMTDPFWFTERGTGLWVDTDNVMDVSMNTQEAGVFRYAITDSAAVKNTVFVETSPHAVYQDYIGIAGTPQKSDATPEEYAKPLFNSWAQMYTTASQDSVLKWAQGLHDNNIPTHTIQIDDGWMTHYGDFDFNNKFPDPKKLSDQIHAMGYNLGLWVTLWINTDSNNFQYAANHGYLLKSKGDPSQPCKVTWWNGVAGIVDLANPAARQWYVGQLQNLEQKYDVNGFKFDTRFFDESCAPYPGYTALDYIKLGAQLTDQFDQQGAGVRLSWTGSQKYGFVIREVDKGTGWNSLQAGVAQAMSISTIGYPFVETDMIGGSLGNPPPTKQVLIRWAQAASLMPLMYSSTSPVGVSNPYGTQSYDAQTIDLYRAAAQLHGRLAPYIEQQVQRAVNTGEPIMKPLFFDFPSDTASYTVSDEWLLGDSLLAAPVLTDGTSRNINLPAGQWYDVLHHRAIRGGRTLTNYAADLSQTPMFIRLGSHDAGELLHIFAGR